MTTTKKKNGRQNYDWAKIKTDYVTNPETSLKKIAQKYGIRERTVYDKSKAEGWFATKKKHIEKVTEQAVEKATAKRANALAKEIEAADRIASRILKALDDEEQFNRYIVNETVSDENTSMSTSNEKIFSKVDMRALKDAAQTLKLVEEMKRSMLNIQRADQINRERREERRLEMEEERLRMEQARANLATGDEDDFGIMILPEVLADE